MEIDKINEAFRRIINELSPELKNKVKDTRKAQYLAAQASADMAKERYEKTAKLVGITQQEYRQSAKDVKSTLQGVLSDWVSLDKDFEDGDFTLSFYVKDEYVEDNEVSKSAIDQLKELLDKMSDKYGIAYTYKIEKTRVTVIWFKPEEFRGEPEDQIELMKKGEYDDIFPAIYYVYPNLDRLSIDELVEILDHCSDNSLFPSGFKASYKGYWVEKIESKDPSLSATYNNLAYPAKLAEALIISKEAETLTDLYNVYYAGTELSEEAIKVLANDINENTSDVLDCYYGDIDDIEFINMLEEISDYAPEGVAKIAKYYLDYSKNPVAINKLKALI